MKMTRRRGVIALVAVVLGTGVTPARGQAITPVPGTTTRDIPFTSHDGYPMLGRLTLPDTPGPHAVLMLVQTAEDHGVLRHRQALRGLRGHLRVHEALPAALALIVTGSSTAIAA